MRMRWVSLQARSVCVCMCVWVCVRLVCETRISTYSEGYSWNAAALGESVGVLCACVCERAPARPDGEACTRARGCDTCARMLDVHAAQARRAKGIPSRS